LILFSQKVTKIAWKTLLSNENIARNRDTNDKTDSSFIAVIFTEKMGEEIGNVGME
jgi:hypothetical protein